MLFINDPDDNNNNDEKDFVFILVQWEDTVLKCGQKGGRS